MYYCAFEFSLGFVNKDGRVLFLLFKLINVIVLKELIFFFVKLSI